MALLLLQYLILVVVLFDWSQAKLSIASFKVDRYDGGGQEPILGTTVNFTCAVEGYKVLMPFLFGKVIGRRCVKLEETKESDHIFWAPLMCVADDLRTVIPCPSKSKPIVVRQLRLTNVTADDKGTYCCKVFAIVGNMTQEKTLDVSPTRCIRGHYCTEYSADASPCPAGSYNPEEGRFEQSSCLTCPQKHYCEAGSVFPTPCSAPAGYGDISTNGLTSENMWKGWKKQHDCGLCPVTTRCRNSTQCNFICPTASLVSVKNGEDVTLECRIMNRSLVAMPILWYKMGNNTKHKVDDATRVTFKGGTSMLHLEKVGQKDATAYVCEGVETYFNTTVMRIIIVNVEDTPPAQHVQLLWLLLIVPIVLLLLLVGIIVATRRKHSRHRKKSDRTSFIDAEIDNMSDDEVFDHVDGVHALDKNQSLYPSTDTDCYQQGNDDTTCYDVFICYSNVDSAWVRGVLVRELERRKIKACIDYRNFRIGANIMTNIADAIYQSKKTIAVLSPDFIDSEYCKHELHSALCRMENHQVIPVLYRLCDVPNVLRDKTYLDWCNNDVSPHFWRQLIKAIRKEPTTQF